MYFFQSNFFLLEKNKIFLLNEIQKVLSMKKFIRNLALADWRKVYQQKNFDEKFVEFNRIFLTTLEKHASTEKKLFLI